LILQLPAAACNLEYETNNFLLTIKPFKMRMILLFTTFVCMTLAALADGDYKKRRNCWGIFSWRYKVTANARLIGTDPRYSGDGRQDGTCNSLAQCTAAGTFRPFPNSEPQVVASVTSKIGPNQPGVVTTWQHWQHFGKFLLGADPGTIAVDYPSVAFHQSMAADSAAPQYAGVLSSASTRDIIFDDRSHSIIIDGITGNLGVNVYDMANAYTTIKIWVLDARNVKDEKDARVITTMQAFVLNGQLVLQGGFTQQDFQQPDRTKAAYTITNVTKTVYIDPAISLDDIIVRVGSDAGVMSMGVAKDYQPDFNAPEVKQITEKMEAEAAFKLNVLQNPAKNNLTIVMANGKKTFEAGELVITSMAGKPVKQVYTGKIDEQSTRYFTTDVTSLQPGMYFVTLVTNTGDRFTRKFIKQE
jgi:Secretion system C-terminal sorting domain